MGKIKGIDDTPPCSCRITVEMTCPVPGCDWRSMQTKTGGDIPAFRRTFGLHWRTDHFGRWDLLKNVDLTPGKMDMARMAQELDRIGETHGTAQDI